MQSINSYTQVLLLKPVGKGLLKTVVFIPTEFAKVGKYLKIKNEDGWKVEEVYSTFSAKHVEKYRTDFKTVIPSAGKKGS